MWYLISSTIVQNERTLLLVPLINTLDPPNDSEKGCFLNSQSGIQQSTHRADRSHHSNFILTLTNASFSISVFVQSTSQWSSRHFFSWHCLWAWLLPPSTTLPRVRPLVGLAWRFPIVVYTPLLLRLPFLFRSLRMSRQTAWMPTSTSPMTSPNA